MVVVVDEEPVAQLEVELPDIPPEVGQADPEPGQPGPGEAGAEGGAGTNLSGTSWRREARAASSTAGWSGGRPGSSSRAWQSILDQITTLPAQK
jgi:hypothetical protein